MDASRSAFVERTLDHYRARFAEHGETPRGVDWNSVDYQHTLFAELARLLPAQGPYAVNDLGCGYGALADWLLVREPAAAYRGYDINAAMIDAARRRHAASPNVAFDVDDRPTAVADYGFASGIFTLRLERSDAECLAAMTASLDALDGTSRAGFAFNALTSYSDADRMRGDLYYPDPCVLFDLCKRRYARDVALLHDYGLYGFTILVRKTAGPPR